jgi:hypothetical protein
MASGVAPWWKRLLYKLLPFLFKTCPGGNRHWRWDRLCYCRVNEHDGVWHGGVLDFRNGLELMPREEFPVGKGDEWCPRCGFILKRRSVIKFFEHEPQGETKPQRARRLRKVRRKKQR